MAAPIIDGLDASSAPAVTRRALSVSLHTDDDVAELIAHLDSPTRSRPVVIVSTRNSGQMLGVSPRKLAEQLRGRADVYVLTTAALAWRLDHRPEYRTYGGAVRVVGVHSGGEVIRTDRDPDNVIDRVAAAVDTERRRTPPPVPPAPAPVLIPGPAPTPLDLLRRRVPAPDLVAGSDPSADVPARREAAGRDDALRREADAVQRSNAELRAALDEERHTSERLRAELSAAQQIAVGLEAQRDDERALRAGAESRVSAAAHELAAARTEIDRLRAALSEQSAALFADPEEQFRDDVQRTWLRTVAEPERGRYPLRAFTLGPAFLDSLEMPQAPRTKIVEVVVDVLTRRAYEMASRSVRPHGSGGPAGVAGQVTRGDGATGYRANIRSNTPQAPRLMWWELTDGTVELALAGRHDDAMPV